MKKLALIVALMAPVLLGSVSAQTAYPSASPEKIVGPTCKLFSRSPELYTFYGNKDRIVKQLSKIPAILWERRVFLQITQGSSRASVTLYVQEKDDKFTVTKWTTTADTSALVSKIDQKIIANAGEDCVSEKIKDLLDHDNTLESPTATPNSHVDYSPEVAFRQSVQNASGNFFKTTLFILC
jgi:hypothetical protein